MAEPFKNLVGPGAVDTLAARLGLDDGFRRDALDGLDALELKARVAHVADALRAHLPAHWPDALAQVLRSLPAPGESFAWWPVLALVERHGLEHPEVSIPALRELTQRFSAEFAIRPYIVRWPEETRAALQVWVTDGSEHVRRLVSEGTRPRLPWGGRLRDFPALDLLEPLVSDPSEYVRRSVANHLGDVAKDDPELAVATARRWAERSPTVAKHGLRHLVKRGHPGALALLGAGPARLRSASLRVEPGLVEFPGEIALVAEIDPDGPQRLVVDYVIRFPGGSAKTFKWATRDASGSVRLDKRHALRPISTRTYRAGPHRVLLQVNGAIVAEATFELLLAR